MAKTKTGTGISNKGGDGGVAYATATKPKSGNNRKNNPLVPSLLRKTKGGNGFVASRLKMPFGQRGGGGVATAVPGQSFPEKNSVAPVPVGVEELEEGIPTEPPFSNLTIRDDSVQISDLTDPLMMNQQREPPPVDEIRAVKSHGNNASGNDSVTSSLSHSVVSRKMTKKKEVVQEMQQTATKAVHQVVQAAEVVMQDGIELLHQTLIDQPCQGAPELSGTTTAAIGNATKIVKPSTNTMKMNLGSGMILQAPSPITLSRVVLQDELKQPPQRAQTTKELPAPPKPTLKVTTTNREANNRNDDHGIKSPVSDAAVNMEPLPAPISPQTDASVIASTGGSTSHLEVDTTNHNVDTSHTSHNAAHIDAPKNVVPIVAALKTPTSSSNKEKKKAKKPFRAVKAMWNMVGLKQSQPPSTAVGIPVVMGTDVMNVVVDSPTLSNRDIPEEENDLPILTTTAAVEQNDPDINSGTNEEEMAGTLSTTVPSTVLSWEGNTSVDVGKEKGSPPSGQRLPSPIGIHAAFSNQKNNIPLEPPTSPSSLIAPTRFERRIPEEPDDENNDHNNNNPFDNTTDDDDDDDDADIMNDCDDDEHEPQYLFPQSPEGAMVFDSPTSPTTMMMESVDPLRTRASPEPAMKQQFWSDLTMNRHLRITTATGSSNIGTSAAAAISSETKAMLLPAVYALSRPRPTGLEPSDSMIHTRVPVDAPEEDVVPDEEEEDDTANFDCSDEEDSYGDNNVRGKEGQESDEQKYDDENNIVRMDTSKPMYTEVIDVDNVVGKQNAIGSEMPEKVHSGEFMSTFLLRNTVGPQSSEFHSDEHLLDVIESNIADQNRSSEEVLHPMSPNDNTDRITLLDIIRTTTSTISKGNNASVSNAILESPEVTHSNVSEIHFVEHISSNQDSYNPFMQSISSRSMKNETEDISKIIVSKREGYNPFEGSSDGTQGKSNEVCTKSIPSGNAIDNEKGSTLQRINPFQRSEASGSKIQASVMQNINAMYSAYSSEASTEDVFEKVALMNKVTKPQFIDQYGESSDDDEGIPVPAISSFKNSAEVLTSALLKGQTSALKKTPKFPKHRPLSERSNRRNILSYSLSNQMEKEKGIASTSQIHSAPDMLDHTYQDGMIPTNDKTQDQLEPTPSNQFPFLPNEIEIEEGGMISDLDQSLRHFPLRMVDAAFGTVEVSAFDHNVNDAQETITIRESFDERIDRYAVSPSMELLRQRTRGVGFLSPDGRTSPALADSITEAETIVAEPESKDVTVPNRAGLLGFCNPFVLASMFPPKLDRRVTTMENDTTLIYQKTVSLGDSFSYGQDSSIAGDCDNKLNGPGTTMRNTPKIEDAESQNNVVAEKISRRKKGIQQPLLHRIASSQLRQDENVGFAPEASVLVGRNQEPSQFVGKNSYKTIENAYSGYPDKTPRISNEAHHLAFSTDVPESPIGNVSKIGSNILETKIAEQNSNLKDKGIQEPLVHRIAATKARHFFDEEADEDDETERNPFVDNLLSNSVILRIAEDPTGATLPGHTSYNLSSSYVADLQQAESDDFEPPFDRYRSVEETPLNPREANYLNGEDDRLLNFVVALGKEAISMSPSSKELFEARLEKMSPLSKGLVEKSVLCAEIDQMIHSSVSDEEVASDLLANIVEAQNYQRSNQEDSVTCVATGSDNIPVDKLEVDDDGEHTNMMLTLGGSHVQRLLITKSADGTIRSLEAVLNETAYGKQCAGTVRESKNPDDINSLSVELAESLKSLSMDVSSANESNVRGDTKAFGSICESFSQRVDVKTLRFAMNKLNQELKQNIKGINPASKGAVKALVDDTTRMLASSNKTVIPVYDLIDLTGVGSQDELQDEEAVWLFDLDTTDAMPGPDIILEKPEHERKKNSVERSQNQKELLRDRKATSTSIKNPEAFRVEDVLYRMCEGGERMICGPAGSTGTDLTKKDEQSSGENFPRCHEVDGSDTSAFDPSVQLTTFAKNADIPKNFNGKRLLSSQSMEYSGTDIRVGDEDLILASLSMPCETAGKLLHERSENQTLVVMQRILSTPNSIAYESLQLTDVSSIVPELHEGHLENGLNRNENETLPELSLDVTSNGYIQHKNMDDILYSVCGDVENAVSGFEGYEVVPAKYNDSFAFQHNDISQDNENKNLGARAPFAESGNDIDRSSLGIAQILETESSMSSTDDFPTILAKMKRDLRKTELKEFRQPPLPEDVLQSSAASRKSEGIRKSQSSPVSDLVDNRRDFLEILFDTTEAMLCGGTAPIVPNAVVRKSRPKDKRKGRKRSKLVKPSSDDELHSLKLQTNGEYDTTMTDRSFSEALSEINTSPKLTKVESRNFDVKKEIHDVTTDSANKSSDAITTVPISVPMRVTDDNDFKEIAQTNDCNTDILGCVGEQSVEDNIIEASEEVIALVTETFLNVESGEKDTVEIEKCGTDDCSKKSEGNQFDSVFDGFVSTVGDRNAKENTDIATEEITTVPNSNSNIVPGENDTAEIEDCGTDARSMKNEVDQFDAVCNGAEMFFGFDSNVAVTVNDQNVEDSNNTISAAVPKSISEITRENDAPSTTDVEYCDTDDRFKKNEADQFDSFCIGAEIFFGLESNDANTNDNQRLEASVEQVRCESESFVTVNSSDQEKSMIAEFQGDEMQICSKTDFMHDNEAKTDESASGHSSFKNPNTICDEKDAQVKTERSENKLRQGPKPENYIATNVQQVPKQDFSTSNLKTRKRVSGRCAPRPEVYGLDKSNCISGYVNVPLFHTTINGSTQKYCNGDIPLETSSEIEPELYRDSSDTLSSKLDGFKDTLSNLQYLERKESAIFPASEKGIPMDVLHLRGMRQRGHGSVFATSDPTVGDVLCEETLNPSVTKKAIGNVSLDEVEPNRSTTNETKTVESNDVINTFFEDVFDKEFSLECSPHNSCIVDIMKVAETIMSRDFGKPEVDFKENREFNRSDSTRLTRDVGNPDSEINENHEAHHFNSDMKSNATVPAQKEIVSQNATMYFSDKPDIENQISNESMVVNTHNPIELNVSKIQQHVDNLGQRPETPIVLEDIGWYSSKKSFVPFSGSHEDSINKDMLNEKLAENLSVATGNDLNLLNRNITTVQHIEVNCTPVVESVDVSAEEQSNSSVEFRIEESQTVQIVRAHDIGKCDRAVLSPINIEVVSVVPMESTGFFGNTDDMCLHVDRSDRSFLPPTNIEGISALLMERTNSDSNSDVLSLDHDRNERNTENQRFPGSSTSFNRSPSKSIFEKSEQIKPDVDKMDPLLKPHPPEIISVLSLDVSEPFNNAATKSNYDKKLDAKSVTQSAIVPNLFARSLSMDLPALDAITKDDQHNVTLSATNGSTKLEREILDSTSRSPHSDALPPSDKSVARDDLYIPLEILIKKKSRMMQRSIGQRETESEKSDTPRELPLADTTINHDSTAESSKMNDIYSVSKFLKKIRSPNNATTMTQMIDLLDDELSDDDGESLSLILALTRSETDTSSINGSVSPQSITQEILTFSKDLPDFLALDEASYLPKEAGQYTFRSRIDRAKAMAMKAKKTLEQNQAMTPLSSYCTAYVSKTMFPRSPLLAALLQRLNKVDKEKIGEKERLTLMSTDIQVQSEAGPKSIVSQKSQDASNINCVPISVQIPDLCMDVMQRLDIDKEKSEKGSFSFDQVNSKNVHHRNTDGSSASRNSTGNGILAHKDIQNPSSYDLLAENDLLTETEFVPSETEGNSPCQLSTLLDRLDINVGKSESFSITSTDVEPLDVEDLFKRYDKIVKHMVVLDEDRLARAQARSTPIVDPGSENNQRSDLDIDTDIASCNQSEKIATGRNNSTAKKTPQLLRVRSQSVGSIGLNAATSDLTTPSQKARDLRHQLEEALQSSAAIRNTQTKLGKEISTLQWKVKERRAQTQYSPNCSRFSTKSAPSSPQTSSNSRRSRSFYHRNCCTPSTDTNTKPSDIVTGGALSNRSASKKQIEKSPIARIRGRSARRHLRDFGSSPESQFSPWNNEMPNVQKSTFVVDTIPYDVSIVDLVSKSTNKDSAIPQSINVDLPQFPTIVDLVSMSHSIDDNTNNDNDASANNADKRSDITMNYSDDNDDEIGNTTDMIQQQQIQNILCGLYQSEPNLTHQLSKPISSTGDGTRYPNKYKPYQPQQQTNEP